MTTSRALEFSNAIGEVKRARLDLPADGSAIASAVLVHAFSNDRVPGTDRMLSRELNRYGIAVAVLGYPDDGIDGSPADVASDVRALASELEAAVERPRLLVGHSWPAAALIEVARSGGVGGLAFVNPVLSEVDLPSASEMSLFLAQAGGDRMGKGEPVSEHVERLGHRATYVPIRSNDPQLSDPTVATYAASMLALWARSIQERLQEDVKHREKHDNCTVAVTRRDPYRTEILSNGHSVVTDEPRELGGTNTGPTPYDLFMASLASCTSITLRMYADRKNWPLEAIHVRLTHERVHAEDCDCDAGERTGMLDVIRKFVTLEGDLDEAQQKRLMQIAEMCPVQRTINGQPVVIPTLQPTEKAVLECR